jgi:hypothetical protein
MELKELFAAQNSLMYSLGVPKIFLGWKKQHKL